MTTEEIEKAFSSHIANYEKMIGQPIKHRQDALHHFTQGMSVSDKHWQEKTRWIPVEERLPEVKASEYPIYAKNEREKNDYAILVIDDQLSLEYLKKAFTHWKEIE